MPIKTITNHADTYREILIYNQPHSINNLFYGERKGSLSAGTPAFAVAAIFLALHIISCIPALIAALVLRKKPIKEGLTANTFKLYFFIATATTTLLALFGVTLLGKEYDSNFATEFVLWFPLCVVITNLIISALAVNIISIWENSKFASIIMGIIIIALLLLFIPIVIFINDSSNVKIDEDPDAAAAQIAIDNYNEGDDEEYESESYGDEYNPDFLDLAEEVEGAAKYLYSKLNLRYEDVTPFDFIQRWKHSSRNVEEDENGKGDYNTFEYDSEFFTEKDLAYPNDVLPQSQNEFNSAKKSFYKFAKLYKNNKIDAILQLYSLYSDLFFSTINSNVYTNKSFNHLVNYALLSYNDIYSRDNPEYILEWIYKVMSDPEKELPLGYQEQIIGTWGTSEYYPHIKKYISPDVFAQITTDNEEAYNEAVAVWAYSFWARRYHDGTHEVTYSILTTIQNHFN